LPGAEEGHHSILPGQTAWDILVEDRWVPDDAKLIPKMAKILGLVDAKPLRRAVRKPNTRGEWTLRTDIPTNIVAALIQVTGKTAQQKCSRCAKSYAALWKECILPTNDAVYKHVHGACACCAYRGRASDCNLSVKCKFADQKGGVPKAMIQDFRDKLEEACDELATPDTTREDVTAKLRNLSSQMREELEKPTQIESEAD
jgi:hypothetical protein